MKAKMPPMFTEESRKHNAFLDVFVKTLSKNTLLSDLTKMNDEQKTVGILLKFWRVNGNTPSFVDWLSDMQRREEAHHKGEKIKPMKKVTVPGKEEIKKKKKAKIIPEKKTEAVSETPKPETDMERIERRLKEITEKYND